LIGEVRHLHTGNPDYLYVTITRNATIPDGTTVEFSLSLTGVAPSTWNAATLLGTASTVRRARLLYTSPAGLMPAAGTYDLHVRFSDSPATPVVEAYGQVVVH